MVGTERCIKHRKELIGVCNWCGVRMCELCVADRNGNKIYCEKCAVNLSHYKKAKTPMPALKQSAAPRDEKQSSGKPPAFEPYY